MRWLMGFLGWFGRFDEFERRPEDHFVVGRSFWWF